MLVLRHRLNVLADPCKHGQVRDRLKFLAFSVRLDQGSDVLAAIRSAKRQDQGSVGVKVESSKLMKHARPRLLEPFVDMCGRKIVFIIREEALEVSSRGDHGELQMRTFAVLPVLLIAFVPRAGDHKVRGIKTLLLRIDPSIDAQLLVRLLPGPSLLKQVVELGNPERMPGEDKGCVERGCDLSRYITGICIVPMNKRRRAPLTTREGDHSVYELIQVRPEALLSDVLASPTLESDKPALGRKLLDFLPIVIRNSLVADSPGEQIDAFNPLAAAERLGQLEHVSDLPSGVSVTSHLDVLAANQAMNADELGVHDHPPSRIARVRGL